VSKKNLQYLTFYCITVNFSLYLRCPGYCYNTLNFRAAPSIFLPNRTGPGSISTPLSEFQRRARDSRLPPSNPRASGADSGVRTPAGTYTRDANFAVSRCTHPANEFAPENNASEPLLRLRSCVHIYVGQTKQNASDESCREARASKSSPSK
jgi:hypothetical protein